MNKVIIKGRLTKDIEIKETQSAKVTHFSVAVDRRVKTGEQKQADFISCVAFNTTAEFLSKYFKKGQEILIVGHLQTGSYDDKDGKKIYTTDVIVEETEFCGRRETSEEFKVTDKVTDDELPF